MLLLKDAGLKSCRPTCMHGLKPRPARGCSVHACTWACTSEAKQVLLAVWLQHACMHGACPYKAPVGLPMRVQEMQHRDPLHPSSWVLCRLALEWLVPRMSSAISQLQLSHWISTPNTLTALTTASMATTATNCYNHPNRQNPHREELMSSAVVAIATDGSKKASELGPDDWTIYPLEEIMDE